MLTFNFTFISEFIFIFLLKMYKMIYLFIVFQLESRIYPGLKYDICLTVRVTRKLYIYCCFLYVIIEQINIDIFA